MSWQEEVTFTCIDGSGGSTGSGAGFSGGGGCGGCGGDLAVEVAVDSVTERQKGETP